MARPSNICVHNQKNQLALVDATMVVAAPIPHTMRIYASFATTQPQRRKFRSAQWPLSEGGSVLVVAALAKCWSAEFRRPDRLLSLLEVLARHHHLAVRRLEMFR